MKTVFYNTSGLTYALDSDYIESTKQHSVLITSKYSGSKDPDYERRLLQINLTESELSSLIDGLKHCLYESQETSVS